MVSMLAYPKSLADAKHGAVLTFIIPALNGCGLNCPHCYIKQRKETHTGPTLEPDDYAFFVESISKKRMVSCVSIQGVEALAADSIIYTEAILRKTTELDIPTALVSNGVELKNTWPFLAKHRLDEMIISIDGSSPEAHDSIRGVEGTFFKVIEGIDAAMKHPSLRKALSVASVLLPGKASALEDMPNLLKQLGIKKWFVTPAIKIGQIGSGSPIEKLSTICQNLNHLNMLASEAGIKMIVEDEFNHYEHERLEIKEAKKLKFRNLDNPDGLIRLQPSGACEIGRQLLKEYDTDSPVWSSKTETPNSFYQKALAYWNIRNGIWE